MKLRIRISCSGSSERKEFELAKGETFKFGRSHKQFLIDGNDTILSREHFKLEFDGTTVTITNLSSTNFTGVKLPNEKKYSKVDQQKVNGKGCRVAAGSHRLKLTIPDDFNVAPVKPTPTDFYLESDPVKPEDSEATDSDIVGLGEEESDEEGTLFDSW